MMPLGDGIARLEARLASPLHRVDLAGLLELWQHDDVIVETVRPKQLEDCPDLPLRVRGALGNALADASRAGQFDPGPFDRPDTFRLLFDWTPPGKRGGEIAQPAIILSDVIGNRVEVRVRLFGLAAWHGPRVLGALASALEGGVAVRNRGVRVCFAVKSARIERFAGVALDWNGNASSAVLSLCTPMVIRRAKRVQITPESLFRAILRRPAALAPWMRCALLEPGPELNRTPDTTMAGIHAERWERTSKRDPGIGKIVEGFGGVVRIDGKLDNWIPWLRLAELTAIGSETALGMGAFRLNLF